jgi:hypothetical protein
MDQQNSFAQTPNPQAGAPQGYNPPQSAPQGFGPQNPQASAPQGYNQQGYNQQNQRGYTPPPPPPPQKPAYSPFVPNNSAPLSTGQYFLMMFLLGIPILNIILVFMWAFGDSNLNKKHFARAILIWALIGIILSVVSALVLWPIFNQYFEITLPWQ